MMFPAPSFNGKFVITLAFPVREPNGFPSTYSVTLEYM
jgi:hypothetical protein